jgi:lysine biosynthesis protein LysW
MEVRCSYCDSIIELPSDVVQGEILKCRECGAIYEVKFENENSLSITEAEMVEEDWGE